MNREQRERHEQGETAHTSFRAFRGENSNELQRTLPFNSMNRERYEQGGLQGTLPFS